MTDIDFVIIWVDGNDLKWQKEKEKYTEDTNYNKNNVRYRDWENLNYWFRGIEKFTPWVRKIHFVTWGHLPKWLDINNPKLNIVKHEEFIPNKYLPTFSSQCIELNLHRIKGLAENFVYFNDDMFIINKMKKNDFFKNNLPCDSAILNAQLNKRNCNSSVLTNNMEVINDYFDKNKMFRKDILKYINFRYGINVMRTLLLFPWNYITGFLEIHLPSSFNKSTFNKIWDVEEELLDKTCMHKFRTKEDVNQWLFRDWQLASGNFVPRNLNVGKYFMLSNNNDNIFSYIKNQKYKMICLNDNDEIIDFEKQKKMLNEAFQSILKEKSSFEI